MLDPVSILAAISAANGAYATLKTCATNANEAWKCAAKFLEAKTQVDVQAQEDKANGKTSTEAFLAHIDLKRKQKELDEFIAYSCEGWVIREWNEHKKRLEDDAYEATIDSRKKIRKKQQKDDDVKNAIIAFTIICGLLAIGSLGVVMFGIV